MEIRSCKPQEFQQILQLVQESKQPTSTLGPYYLEGFMEAIEDEQLMGVIGSQTYPPFGLITHLAIRPECSKPEVAKKLTEALESWAHRKGVSELYLLVKEHDQLHQLGYKKVERKLTPNTIFQCLLGKEFADLQDFYLGKKLLH